MKPRITLADARAYQRALDLLYNQRVLLGGEKATAVGRYEDRLVFKVKGKLQNVYPGDPRLLEMVVVEKEATHP